MIHQANKALKDTATEKDKGWGRYRRSRVWLKEGWLIKKLPAPQNAASWQKPCNEAKDTCAYERESFKRSRSQLAHDLFSAGGRGVLRIKTWIESATWTRKRAQLVPSPPTSRPAPLPSQRPQGVWLEGPLIVTKHGFNHIPRAPRPLGRD